MKDPEWKVRRNAAESLGFFPRESEKTVPILLERLKDDSPQVRSSAILSLGKLGRNNAAVEDALKKLADDSDSVVKLNAAVALALLGKVDDSALPLLIQALESGEEATAKAAGRVLADIGLKEPQKVLPSVMEALDKNEAPLAGNALRVLRNMRTLAAPSLPRVVALYDGADVQTRRDIVDTVLAVDKKGEYALGVMIKALKEPDVRDRKEALIGMMRFRPRPDLMLDPVLGVLKDEDPANRLIAVNLVKALGQDSLKGLPDLIALTDDPDMRVRNAVVPVIASFRPTPPEVLPAVEKSLQDKDFRVRITAATALKQLFQDYPDKVTELLKKAHEEEQHEGTKRTMASILKSLNEGTARTNREKAEKTDRNTARP